MATGQLTFTNGALSLILTTSFSGGFFFIVILGDLSYLQVTCLVFSFFSNPDIFHLLLVVKECMFFKGLLSKQESIRINENILQLHYLAIASTTMRLIHTELLIVGCFDLQSSNAVWFNLISCRHIFTVGFL